MKVGLGSQREMAKEHAASFTEAIFVLSLFAPLWKGIRIVKGEFLQCASLERFTSMLSDITTKRGKGCTHRLAVKMLGPKSF